MKVLVVVAICAALTPGCASEKNIQVNVIDVELVKIEVVQRYPNIEKKLLTWRDVNSIDYITFAPMSSEYKVGSTMKVMVRK